MSKVFNLLNWILYRISGFFFRSAWWLEKLEKRRLHSDMEWLQFQNFQKWYAIDGDNSHRIEYELNSTSIVFDVGGFKGQWAKEIFSRYNCRIFIFEPIMDYYELINRIYIKNSQVIAFNYGLSGSTKYISFSKNNESSSALREAINGNTETCLLKDFKVVLDELNVFYIDLLKINIEGGEYELLERIFELNFQKHVANFQIQFHLNIPNYQIKIDSIRAVLSKTHVCTYNYEYVWENWRLK